jgi:KUP system potassium uptake protein
MASSTEAVSTPAIADHPVRAALLLGALGVVFGDIGTSPIYAFREALKAAGGPSEAAVFGVLSLVFWAIVLVVAIKYVVFVMKADNAGEGGTMALLSLESWRRFVRQGAKVGPSTRRTIAHEDPEAFYGRVQGQGRA